MLQFLGLDGAKGDRWVQCLQQVALTVHVVLNSRNLRA
jgi:hypothetical protein